MTIHTSPMLDTATCQRARLSRDTHFDGRFFTAVLSTGIYCRPICPARAPREENVRYFSSAAAAESAGFRPCLRCRPELAPNDNGQFEHPLIRKLLLWVQSEKIGSESVASLAESMAISERHLRRVCVEELGATPSQLIGTQRLLFAKQLLMDTSLPVSHVALASGFNSQRRFNSAFKAAYALSPGQLRKSEGTVEPSNEVLVFKLNYRPPYDFSSVLSFLKQREIKGLEYVTDSQYTRLMDEKVSEAYFKISQWEGQHALRLEIYLGNSLSALGMLQSWILRIRRMFDLDAVPQMIDASLSEIEWLAPLVEAHHGIRIPQIWNGWEAAVRAIVGQQVSIKAATTIVTRIVHRFGETVTINGDTDLMKHFPLPEVIATGDLSGLGLTSSKIRTLQAVALAMCEGRVGFEQNQSLAQFIDRWQQLRGIGPWTANYLAMRAWGYSDILLHQDLIIQRALTSLSGAKTLDQACRQLEHLSPWRSYITIHLWNWFAMPLNQRSPQP